MDISIKKPGLRDYVECWQAMRAFTEARFDHPAQTDELWLVQHPPVYTLGLNGKREHVLDPGDIPVVPCDRGGQVTYHGPGQWVLYLLLDLKRRNLGIKPLVSLLEQTTIDLLAQYGINAHTQDNAPGVYVDNAKIAALGLRVRRGFCYHGLSLNTAMDLEPFGRINPCGYAGLRSTQLIDLVPQVNEQQLGDELAQAVARRLMEGDKP